MKKNKSERGQSLVELAISLVILLTLLAGAVEFGMAFFQFVQLRDAAQEGALYGSLNPTDNAGIIARIRDSSASPIDLSDTSVIPDSDIVITASGGKCEGEGLEVVISYDHQIFMPFMSQIIGDEITLKASVTDTILSPVCPTSP